MASTATRTRLTKRKIDAITLPKSGEVILRDQDLPGFALRATKGAKTFVVEKRIKGRLHKVKVGTYGPFTIDQAREAARDTLGKLSRGEPLSSQRGDLTFGQFEKLYLQKYAIRKKSYHNEVLHLEKHLSHWRNWKLSGITRKDIFLLHAGIGQKHPVGANRVLSLLRTMFRLAVDWGLIRGESPATRISMFPEASRDRFVQPHELPKLLTALKAEPNPYIQSALLMGLLTGARRSEVLAAQWSDVDLNLGNWRIPQTKSGHWHLLPLPGPLVQTLSELPRVQDNPYVFVGRHGKGHLKNISKAWRGIRKEAGIPDVRIHDLRRTLGSWIAGTGVSLHIVGKILNHRQPSTTAIYSRLNLDPLREVLETNAQRMLLIEEHQYNG
ncbi:MAG: site-specific integrase [Nitrospirales bacterium]|nr:site-specific integrase [Nitrospirales bacterium]